MKRLAMLSVVLVVLLGIVGFQLIGCSAKPSTPAAPVATSKDTSPPPAQPANTELLDRLRENEALNAQRPPASIPAPARGAPVVVESEPPAAPNGPAAAAEDRATILNSQTAVPPEVADKLVTGAEQLDRQRLYRERFDEARNSQAGQGAVGGQGGGQGNGILNADGQLPRLDNTESRQPLAGGGRGGFGGGGGGGRGGRGGRGGAVPQQQQAAGGGRGAPNFGIQARGPARIIWPTANEEVWIIVRPRPQVVMAAPVQDDFPRTGALIARLPDRPTDIAVPLKHTDVKASISGYIATVDVTQQFQNPFSTKIEAVYIFPLPHNAAINEFVMTVGERKIRGIIRERQEAEQIYAEARAQGIVASLLTQERPNIFTQKVANIEPSKQIDINIKYYHTLDYMDGWYEWHFPMVVGPRFNPSGWTDGIGAAPVGGSTGQPTDVQYLRPEQRNGHDISLAVSVNAGVRIEQMETPNHRVTSNLSGAGEPAGATTIKLSSGDSIPNRDFVLRYKVAGQTLKSALMVQRDPRGQGGYFTLMLVPPESMKNLPRQPLEMVFTLDVSGSMNGKPFEQSRSAIEYALKHMDPQDTFQVIRFATGTEMMTPQAVPATPENVRAALAYVQNMASGGGTNMLEGIRASLQFPRDEERTRYVAFLTDGFIGNEVQILREIKNSKTDSRIFSFGVGNSVNRYLLDHMAKMGAGAVAYLGLNDDAGDIMSAYFDRIQYPALTDIAVDYGNMQVSDVFPAKVPDLIVGRPVILTGRYTGRGPSTVRVTGRVGGQMRTFDIPVNLDDSASQHAGITSVWARMKIAALADQSAWDDSQDFADPIRKVAIDYGLMSQFTAYVAVDSSTRTGTGPGTTVQVPVPVPEGVRYDTTVPEGGPVIRQRP